jgi:hypothetical protein
MSLQALTADEREVVRRALAATIDYFDFDFEMRLGVSPEVMRQFVAACPNIDDTNDDSDACLAINNSLNDLLNGVGISEEESLARLGVGTDEVRRIYKKWARARGWTSTGVR